MTEIEKNQFPKNLKTSSLKNIVPFWERFSIDKDAGGYFSCLDRDGTVFDTDKFLWMQGRELWCWSYLYRMIDPKPQWLENGFSLAPNLSIDTGNAPKWRLLFFP